MVATPQKKKPVAQSPSHDGGLVRSKPTTPSKGSAVTPTKSPSTKKPKCNVPSPPRDNVSALATLPEHPDVEMTSGGASDSRLLFLLQLGQFILQKKG